MNLSDPITFYYVVSFATSSIIVVLAAVLLMLHIPSDNRLTNFRYARNYLSLSYFVLGISGFLTFFMQQEAEDKSLLASCTLIVASYQALLFTYTILALIQPLYIKRKVIFTQFVVITIVGAALLLALFFLPHSLFLILLYTVVVAYFCQILYYTYIFRQKYSECLSALSEYYDEDECSRLRWTYLSFYSALAIGILALASLFMNLYFYTLFSILYTIYYAYMVSRLYNYQIDFKFAIPVITQKKETASSKDNEDEEPSAALIEKSEQFKGVLEKWVVDKKFSEKDVSVDIIAESLGVNRSFLQYYFRTYMQTDFRTWRSELRIREAQKIFDENSEISLGRVCELVGFNHRANFHQQFQKITGLTPTEYRQKQEKQS